MKEELIKFETAKLAKEKGFDIESNGHAFFNVNGKIVEGHIAFSGEYENLGLAPTQSLLQKFLWEEHNIWVQSTPLFSSNECIGVTVTISSWKFPVIQVHYQGFDVYEGLEEGLQEALKLIKSK